jgi:adenosine deaminase/aminodeoxyfutalosine deaminase
MAEFAELHVHLEGTVTPEMVCEMNPSVRLEEAQHAFQFSNFSGFISSYIWVNRQLDRPERYALVARRLVEAYRAQNVTYAEVNLSAGVVLWKQQDFGCVFDAIDKAVRDSGVRIRWVLDAVRQFGAEEAMKVARLAAERRDCGVVGFGFGGDESRGPAEWFADVCRYARNEGLAVLPHAGETAGPDSIWAALECGALRIGHGIRAIDDPVLVRHLAERRIPLEISITSNLCTGAVGSLAEHPVRKLYDAGVPITLNTDDPGFFRTTIAREFEIARDAFGFSEAELDGIRQNAFRYAVP